MVSNLVPITILVLPGLFFRQDPSPMQWGGPVELVGVYETFSTSGGGSRSLRQFLRRAL